MFAIRHFVFAGLLGLLLCVALPAEAEPQKAEAAAQKPAKAKKKATDCAALEKTVRAAIPELNKCWMDEDCGTEYLGCPWQAYACDWTIIGRNDTEKEARDKLKKNIAAYQSACVTKDKKRAAQCSAFEKERALRDCPPEPKLLCLNGKCVTQTHVLMQGVEGGVDIYGSRRLVGVPKDEAGTPEPIDPAPEDSGSE